MMTAATRLRTDAEIEHHLNNRPTKGDLFDFGGTVLLCFLPYGVAREHLKPGVTEKEWESARMQPTRAVVLGEMREYIDFAFEKANGERSISALRSPQKYQAWLWLLGDEELAEEIGSYTNYGLPQLRAINAKYGLGYEEN
jgi:hypothetical protein